MSAGIGTPAATRAVVIGIERYAGSLFQDVNAPANNARQFVSWLLDRGVPHNNISVLVAPLSGNHGPFDRLIPGGYGHVTGQAIRTVFTGLEDQDGTTLIVYWAGHGYEDGLGGGQHLVVPDSGGTSHLAVNRLLAHLAGERIPFGDQLLFVDACRQHYGSLGTTLPEIQFPAAPRAGGRRQSVLHAAAIGAESALVAAEKTSVFGKYLMPALRDRPRGEWPPDIPSLAETLTAHADDRLAPVRLTSIDQRGNQTTVTIGTPSDKSAAVESGRLTELLSAIPELDRPSNRKLLVRRLREKFEFRFPALSASPTIVEIADVLARMDSDGARLREVCDERRFDLFIAAAPEVKELKNYLDSLRNHDER